MGGREAGSAGAGSMGASESGSTLCAWLCLPRCALAPAVLLRTSFTQSLSPPRAATPQGMDKKNERLVFQEMVRTSSKANTPQCFLITPKLLPQLDYGKFTTVHVIYNGPHVADVARGFAPERIFGSVPQTPMQTAEVF